MFTPLPALQPSLSPQATSQPPASAKIVQPYQDILLKPGQTVQLAETPLLITLKETHGPDADCVGCPNTAVLELQVGAQVQEVSFAFSGNMSADAAYKARRKIAFGYRLIAIKLASDEFTMRIEPEN